MSTSATTPSTHAPSTPSEAETALQQLGLEPGRSGLHSGQIQHGQEQIVPVRRHGVQALRTGRHQHLDSPDDGDPQRRPLLPALRSMAEGPAYRPGIPRRHHPAEPAEQEHGAPYPELSGAQFHRLGRQLCVPDHGAQQRQPVPDQGRLHHQQPAPGVGALSARLLHQPEQPHVARHLHAQDSGHQYEGAVDLRRQSHDREHDAGLVQRQRDPAGRLPGQPGLYHATTRARDRGSRCP